MRTGSRVLKVVCEPRKREALVIPDQNKGSVLIKTYYNSYSNFWTGRQYVLEYEEIDSEFTQESALMLKTSTPKLEKEGK